MTPAAQGTEGEMSSPQTSAARRVLTQDYRGNPVYSVSRGELRAIEDEAAQLTLDRLVDVAERLHLDLIYAGPGDMPGDPWVNLLDAMQDSDD